MPDFQFFDFLVIGSINTEYIVDLNGRSHHGVVGGPALYTAGGMRCWNDRIAIVSHTRVEHQDFFRSINRKYQISIEGVHFHADFQDDRTFLGYISPHEVVIENPVAFYASRDLTFPRELFGYDQKYLETHEETRFFPEDFPSHYRDCTSALICQTDLKTQLQMSSLLLNASTKNLLLQSSDQYMNMANFDALPALMKDLNVFVTTTAQIENLFRNRSQDTWEMAEHLCNLGCQYVIMHDDTFGQYLVDGRLKKRFQLPAYPVSIVDPTGMQEAFCGGFLTGIKKNYDPVEAMLYGNVSASLTAEGTGPFFCMDAMPGLVDSRLNFARELVKSI